MKEILFVIKIIIIFLTYITGVELIKSQKSGEILQSVLTNQQINKFIQSKFFHKTKHNFVKSNIPFNIITLFLALTVGTGTSIFVYAVSEMIFKVKAVAVIISVPFIFSGFTIIKVIASKKQRKTETAMNDFLIQLKNSIKVNHNIVEACRVIQNNVLEPFKTYIKQMLKEINTGVMPETALVNFSNKVDIKRFSFYIDNLKYEEVYGGDIVSLTNETQVYISEVVKQKKKREKESKSLCLVLYILIFIDLLIYFTFIMKNSEYMNIIQSSKMGIFILEINFISIWVLIFMSTIIKKLDY